MSMAQTPPHTQPAAEQTSGELANGAGLVAIVHKQLAALESLAAEGYAEAAALRAEITTMSEQLGSTIARLARLESTLQSHERMLGAIRGGLLQMPTPQHAPEAIAPSRAQTPAAAPSEAAVERQPEPAPAATPARPTAATEPARPAAATPARPTAATEPARPAPTPARPTAATETARPAPTAVSTRSVPAPEPTPAAPEPSRVTPETRPSPSASKRNDGPQVQRGSTVEVVFEDGTSETYTIVRQEEANPVRNLIGENSPLGTALIGAAVGDTRRYRVRATGPEMIVRVREIV